MDSHLNIMPITAKTDSDGYLMVGGCKLTDLAAQFGTPLVVIDKTTIIDMCQTYKKAFSQLNNIHFLYASKAFICKAMAQLMHEQGFGFDCVSYGDLWRVQSAIGTSEKVLFNGNNKTTSEIQYALDNNVHRFSVDNFSELELLQSLAQGRTIPILLRVAPGIECHTHDYIKTGGQTSKFGFDLSDIEQAVQFIIEHCPSLEIKGLHTHLGSQIFELAVYKDAIEIAFQTMADLNTRFNLQLNEYNMGGGIGISYTEKDTPPSLNEIAQVVQSAIAQYSKTYDIKNPILYLEPGRSIIGTAGLNLYQVGTYKQVPNGPKYVALDGGMGDNIRPVLYQATYTAALAQPSTNKKSETVTLVGRFCESGDVIIKDITLPTLANGDIIAIFDTGAYGYAMSSNYNAVPKPAVIMVENGKATEIIARQTIEQIFENDC